MRLIDADILKRTEGMFQYQINDAFDRLSASAYRFEDVENAPTVEAIPIEWLRKYVDEHDEIVEEGLYWIVEEIIDDWEKENGTDRQR